MRNFQIKLNVLFLSMITLIMVNLVQGQTTNPAPKNIPFVEDFSTLAHASTTYPDGFQGWTISTSPGSSFNTNAPTADRSLVANSNASTTSGNVHNYNGKIGFLNTSSLDLSIVFAINTTGKENIQVTYDVMTIRNPYDGTSNTRINEVTLQYRIGTTGNFVNLTGVEYQNNTTNQTSTTTNPQNLQTKSIVLPNECNNQPIVQLRWASRQVSGLGSRPSFAFDNISVTGSDISNLTPLITVTPTSLSGFQYYYGQGSSAAQTISVSGSNLINNIIVTAPNDYEISLNASGPYGSSLQLPPVGGSVNTNIYVRLKSGLDVGNYNNQQIIFSSTGATDQIVLCNGNVLAIVPELTVAPSTLSGFTYVVGSGPSSENSFTVSGINLNDNIIISPPLNYEISTGTGQNFIPQNPIILVPAGNSVPNTTIYVRLAAGLPTGTYNSETIVISTSGAANKTVVCNGSVTNPAPTASVLKRPLYIDLSSSTSESAVLMKLENYTTDLVKYRLYNGTTKQYNCWNEANDTYVSSTTYANGPSVPGTPSTSSIFWILFQRGNNDETIANYRDRLGPNYSTNHLTVELPPATEINASFVLSGEFLATTPFDNSVRHVVLGYSGNNLISAASTALNTGAFALKCPNGVTIDKVEFRAVDNTLIDQVTGSWSSSAIIFSSPNISVTPSTLSGFSYYLGFGPSNQQTFSVSGTYLTDNILITPSANYEISLTGGSNFNAMPSITLTQTGGNITPTNIYVRLKAGLNIGNYQESIVLSSQGAADKTVLCEGSVLEIVPTINVNPLTLSGFTYEQGSGPSSEQSFTVSGINLTNNITITASQNFEISTGSGSTFVAQPTITLYHTGGVVDNTTIYVRLISGLQVGQYNEIISVESTGATQQNISCNGTVTTPTPSAIVLLRPLYADTLTASSQGAVLMKLKNYPQDNARYRLYNGSYQYNCWNPDSAKYITQFVYSAGPLVPGTPSTETIFWIMYERGGNNSTNANYRDRLGPGYTTNFQTTPLPTATAITNAYYLTGTFTGSGIYTTNTKHVVLAYSGSSLIAAASTTLNTGIFTITCPTGITISKIEIRAVDNTLIDFIEGNWNSSVNVGEIPNIPTTKTLTLQLFIEGLYFSNGVMNESLGDNGYQFGQGIADEIIVELYHPSDLQTPAIQIMNVLLNNAGVATLNIPSTMSETYYIVIKHRNTIETWSALPISFAGSGPIEFNFSTAASQAYGANQKPVNGGFFAIWSGDINKDGIVDTEDMTQIDNASIPPAEIGYTPRDVNGDAIIDIEDMSIIDNNSQFPARQVMKP